MRVLIGLVCGVAGAFFLFSWLLLALAADASPGASGRIGYLALFIGATALLASGIVVAVTTVRRRRAERG